MCLCDDPLCVSVRDVADLREQHLWCQCESSCGTERVKERNVGWECLMVSGLMEEGNILFWGRCIGGRGRGVRESSAVFLDDATTVCGCRRTRGISNSAGLDGILSRLTFFGSL